MNFKKKAQMSPILEGIFILGCIAIIGIIYLTIKYFLFLELLISILLVLLCSKYLKKRIHSKRTEKKQFRTFLIDIGIIVFLNGIIIYFFQIQIIFKIIIFLLVIMFQYLAFYMI
jgi:hypothetical protein